MENVMKNMETIIGGADGPTSVFLAGKIGDQMSTGALIAAIVIGLIICLFGLKLMRILSALTGLSVGAAVGLVVSVFAGVSGITFAIIVFGCAIVGAALFFFLRRFGAFWLVLDMSFGGIGTVLVSVLGIKASVSVLPILIALVVSVILGILGAIFVEPLVIIATSIAGGIMAGTSVAPLAGLGENAWIGCVIGVVIAVIGMIVQFMMQSRKIGKKEKVYSAQIKEKASVESEVEKARMILEDDDEEEKDNSED